MNLWRTGILFAVKMVVFRLLPGDWKQRKPENYMATLGACSSVRSSADDRRTPLCWLPKCLGVRAVISFYLPYMCYGNFLIQNSWGATRSAVFLLYDIGVRASSKFYHVLEGMELAIFCFTRVEVSCPYFVSLGSRR